jgi:two-component system, sensor histidine kinase
MNVLLPEEVTAAQEYIRKLEKINRALMGRVEKSMDFSGGAFSLFQTAILLDDKVKARTSDLELTLENLSEAYANLKDARDDAETAKQNLTAAIDAVSEGFALFDADERLVMCNAPFQELMADVHDHLKPGSNFKDIAYGFSRSQHLLLAMGQSQDSWCSQRLSNFRAPYATFTQAFSGDRWVQISNKKMASGATVIFQTDITDMVRTERVKHERELDEQSKLLQATIDHMPQGISMFSSDRVLRTWNKRFVELLALPTQQVTQRLTLNRLFNVLRMQGFVQEDTFAIRLREWLEASTLESIEGIEINRFDGAVLSFDARAMPNGGLVLNFADVTAERASTLALREAKENLEQRVESRTAELQREIEERRAIEKELLLAKEVAEEANKGKTRFLAAASHDLLQPLNASRIFLSLLLESGLTTRANHLAESADRAFGSVEQLLEALLDISRFETRSVETNVTDFSLSELFETLAAESTPSAERKGLRLRVRPTQLWVRSDKSLLRRIIQNLLSNAIRYTEKGGVLLAARRRNGNVVIEVFDTGVGIPEDKRALVFEEFKRLHATSGNDTKAMGLGLAIVDRIANLLDHKVGLRSVLRQGSCFHVSVPEAKAGEAVENATSHQHGQRLHRPLRSAILIENDMQILAGMVELLETRNIKAIPTVSAEEAAEALDTMESIPDLIVADYHLDNGTGLDAINLLRQKCGKRVPAVIVTANHSPTLKSDLAKSDVALLWKPIKPQLLFETIESVL